MDENRFDQFAKSLATGSTRRQVLGKLASTVVGGALLAFLLPARTHAADVSSNPRATDARDEDARRCGSRIWCNGHCCQPGECCARGLYCASAGDCV